MDDKEVKFTKNNRLIEKQHTGHAGGPMIRKPDDLLGSPKLNKYGMTEFE